MLLSRDSMVAEGRNHEVCTARQDEEVDERWIKEKSVKKGRGKGKDHEENSIAQGASVGGQDEVDWKGCANEGSAPRDRREIGGCGGAASRARPAEHDLHEWLASHGILHSGGNGFQWVARNDQGPGSGQLDVSFRLPEGGQDGRVGAHQVHLVPWL